LKNTGIELAEDGEEPTGNLPPSKGLMQCEVKASLPLKTAAFITYRQGVSNL
jgi:hypothetical protein